MMFYRVTSILHTLSPLPLCGFSCDFVKLEGGLHFTESRSPTVDHAPLVINKKYNNIYNIYNIYMYNGSGEF